MNGRELASYSDGTNNISYKYNLNGIRTSKVVNGIKTNYILEGTSIIFEDRNGDVIYYIYNGSELLGFAYNNNTYYYHKNMFGDIIGILDSNYNEIVKYTYDSWGALVNITDNSNINLSTINPFRYRSYYYDIETGLYYLNSRYYNPEWGRFISGDSMITGQEINSANIFIYCGNNPVDRNDNGNKWSLKKIGKHILNTAKNVKKSVISEVKKVTNSIATETKKITSSLTNFVSNVKKSFTVEWGTGVGAKINVNNFVDVGGATTFGSTYNNGEWHDYNRFSTGATVGLSESIEVGYSHSYTHYEHENDSHDYFMDVDALTTHECVEISSTVGITHTKTNATIEGNFVGLSISFYLITGFDFKIGFMI